MKLASVIFDTSQYLYNCDSKTIIYFNFINFMFSFTFDPLAAIFGISGVIGFFFFVSAAKGTSNINTKPKKID